MTASCGRFSHRQTKPAQTTADSSQDYPSIGRQRPALLWNRYLPHCSQYPQYPPIRFARIFGHYGIVSTTTEGIDFGHSPTTFFNGPPAGPQKLNNLPLLRRGFLCGWVVGERQVQPKLQILVRFQPIKLHEDESAHGSPGEIHRAATFTR